jgi:hypothetical protein
LSSCNLFRAFGKHSFQDLLPSSLSSYIISGFPPSSLSFRATVSDETISTPLRHRERNEVKRDDLRAVILSDHRERENPLFFVILQSFSCCRQAFISGSPSSFSFVIAFSFFCLCTLPSLLKQVEPEGRPWQSAFDFTKELERMCP